MITHARRLLSVNIITAVSSKGDALFTLNKGRTNSSTFCLFMTKLIA
jgi:hypothetical protein